MISLDCVTKPRHLTMYQTLLQLAILDDVTIIIIQDIFKFTSFLQTGITYTVFQNNVVCAMFLQYPVHIFGSTPGVDLVNLAKNSEMVRLN